MRCKFIAWAAVALIGAAPFAGARADVLFDNTAQAPMGSDPILDLGGGGAGPIAASFSTGAQGVDLGSISVVLQEVGGDSGTINVELFTGGITAPGGTGVSIGSIDAGSLATGFDSVSIVLTSSVVLASNQRYWVELSSSDLSASDLTGWAYDGNSLGTGVPGEYTWNNYSPGDASYANDSAGYAYIMQVQTVPEPASLGLLAFGLIGLVVARKRVYVRG